MRKMNSSGIVSACTPVIFAPRLEKSLKMQLRSRPPAALQIFAREFHSTRNFLRRSRAIDIPPIAQSSPYEHDSK
jgi:hypothetical protein